MELPSGLGLLNDQTSEALPLPIITIPKSPTKEKRFYKLVQAQSRLD